MYEYRRILVPLDGSAFGEHALPYAMAIAARSDARLELATVWGGGEDVGVVRESGGASESGADAHLPPAGAWVRRYLDEMVERVDELTGHPPCSRVLAGRVAEALAARAEEWRADLIVMTSHGRGALSRFWLGSAVDGTLRHSPVPVLVVRPPEGAEVELRVEPSVKKVLLPLDGSPAAEAVLDPALSLAALFGAEVKLLQVAQQPREPDSPYIPHAARHLEEVEARRLAEAETYLEGVRAALPAGGPVVETETTAGAWAAEAILRVAVRWQADLIAMASHGRGGVPRLVLGSVADKVVRSSERPVLVFRARV